MDLGEVLIVKWSRVHQNMSLYYLGPFQTSKTELFAKIVFRYKPLIFFIKNSNFDVWLVS